MAIIGTRHAEEARIYDSFAGYHSFHSELRDLNPDEPGTGSLEVFFADAGELWKQDDENESANTGGWYWWACFPGCLPDGEPSGPFGSSRDALEDADEWHPELDD